MMTIRSSIAFLLIAGLSLGQSAFLRAAEPTGVPESAKQEKKPGNKDIVTKDKANKDIRPIDIDRWVEDLDSSSFAKREEASDNLKAAGKVAVPALIRAAIKGDLETTSRAIAILRKGLDASDEATREGAKAALEKVAESDSASAARKAKQALEAKELADAPPQAANPFGGGRIIINGGKLVINGGGVAAKSISVSNNNGVKETNVSEGDKKIKIVDDPAKGVNIEYTHKRGDKEVTDKYEAKNADDMKKNHPEGYKLYKEYAENNANGIGANGFGAGGFGGAIQLQLGGNAQLVPNQIVPNQAVPGRRIIRGNARPAQAIAPQAQGPAPVPLGPIPGPNQIAQNQIAQYKAAPDTAPPAPSKLVPSKSLEVTGMMINTLMAELELMEKDNAFHNADQSAQDALKKQLKELKQRLDSVEQKLAPPPTFDAPSPPIR